MYDEIVKPAADVNAAEYIEERCDVIHTSNDGLFAEAMGSTDLCGKSRMAESTR